jgi:hypothetical protein
MIAVATIVALGFIFFYTDRSLFYQYVQEDGIIEWLTVIGLLSGFVLCLRQRPMRTTIILLAGALLFAAGEEISWGMRIFGWHANHFFVAHNAQEETNLHNMVVAGVKINKLIFSLVLVTAFGIYLVAMPVLYQKKENFRALCDRFAVPVPRLYQVIAFLSLFTIVSLLPDGKNAELLECCGAMLFVLILGNPKNAFVQSRGSELKVVRMLS